MIKVKNYIKDSDNFIPVEEFDGTVPDPEYIDSAMELIINGTPVITRAEWDYMVPLWAYIANGFEELAEKSEWTTGFPDQSIDLTFRVDRQRNKIDVKVFIPKSDLLNLPQETRSAVTDFDEFLTVMSEAGQKFFLRMAEILPEERQGYEYEARRMRDVVAALQSNQ